MKKWLQKTHGTGFELLRHFLVRFFDSDLVTAPGQTATALISVFSLALPWFPLLAGPLRRKYAYFSSLLSPGPYREAVRADELWLITMMMAAIGLLTAFKWQALFPGLRDYRSLGSLPLKGWQIFAAKLLALLIVATAAVLTLNLPPGVTFPMLSAGRWAIRQEAGVRVTALVLASIAGCYFFFFGLVAIQGVLLNLLRARRFDRVTGYLQGFLVGLMLILLVMSFSISPQVGNALVRPEVARWLPPVWFLGLHQVLLGDSDAAMRALGNQALFGLAIGVGLTLLSYSVSYRRHRTLLIEGAATQRKQRRWTGKVFDWLVPDPRRQAAMVFVAKTLAGSNQHRMILMGYGGFGLAILGSGLIGLRDVVKPDRLAAAGFVYAHVILLIFLLLGVRHLFSIPIELKANWAFQITEREGRRQWMDAVDRMVLVCGAVMLALPLPLEIYLLGWRAVGEVVLSAALGALCYEAIFSNWEKLPFTCSHLPGKTPAWVTLLKLLGLLGALPAVNGLLLECLYRPVLFGVVSVLLLTAWTRVHAGRREGWGSMRLKYEETPEPAIHGLNLLK